MEKSFSRKARLREEVGYELRQLQRLAAEAGEHTTGPDSEHSSWDAAAAAKYISDLFGGLENLWKRRCVFLNVRPPAGPDSHLQVLKDFLAAPGLGDSISPGMAARLRKYLDFRHRFIHGYGFMVTWEMVAEPLRDLPETVAVLTAAWTGWLDNLPD